MIASPNNLSTSLKISILSCPTSFLSIISSLHRVLDSLWLMTFVVVHTYIVPTLHLREDCDFGRCLTMPLHTITFAKIPSTIGIAILFLSLDLTIPMMLKSHSKVASGMKRIYNHLKLKNTALTIGVKKRIFMTIGQKNLMKSR